MEKINEHFHLKIQQEKRIILCKNSPLHSAKHLINTCWFFVVFEDLTEHQFIWIPSEGISEYSHWMKVHVRVGALGLVCAGAVIVPNRTIWIFKVYSIIFFRNTVWVYLISVEILKIDKKVTLFSSLFYSISLTFFFYFNIL